MKESDGNDANDGKGSLQLGCLPHMRTFQKFDANNSNLEKTKQLKDVEDSKLVTQNTQHANMAGKFKQTGLLTCALQTAKLVKANNELQVEIDELQKKVNEEFKKTKKKFQEDLTRKQKLSKSVKDRPKLVGVRTSTQPSNVRQKVSKTSTAEIKESNLNATMISADVRKISQTDPVVNSEVVSRNECHVIRDDDPSDRGNTHNNDIDTQAIAQSSEKHVSDIVMTARSASQPDSGDVAQLTVEIQEESAQPTD